MPKDVAVIVRRLPEAPAWGTFRDQGGEVDVQKVARIKMKRVLWGALAGIASIVTMSAFMALARAAGVLGDPPPHKITKNIMKKAGKNHPKKQQSVPAAWALHFAIGASLGALHTLVLDENDQRRVIPSTMYGSGVFAGAYGVMLPSLGLMPPPLFDRTGRPTAMWLAHMVFGATLAGLHLAFDGGARRKNQSRST